MTTFGISDNAQIGTAMLTVGVGLISLGVVLFFNTELLAVGNILFIAGLTIMMGMQRTLRFFHKKFKEMGIRGIACFFGGVALVMTRRPILGMGCRRSASP